MRYLFVGMLLLVVCLESLQSEKRGVVRKDLLGKKPPEIVNEKQHWMGSAKPVSLSSLKGNVIWLQFNF